MVGSPLNSDSIRNVDAEELDVNHMLVMKYPGRRVRSQSPWFLSRFGLKKRYDLTMFCLLVGR